MDTSAQRQSENDPTNQKLGVAETSDDPIRYFDGAIEYSAVDVGSSGFSGFSHVRSYINRTDWSAPNQHGSNWICDNIPALRVTTDGVYYLPRSGLDVQQFTAGDLNDYYFNPWFKQETLFFSMQGFGYKEANGAYTMFQSAATGTPTKKYDAAGHLTLFTYNNVSSDPLYRTLTNVTQSAMVNGVNVTETFAYEYDTASWQISRVARYLSSNGAAPIRQAYYTPKLEISIKKLS